MRPLTFGIGIVATNSRISPAPFAKGVTNASAKKPNSLIDRPADSMCAPPPCLPCTRRRARRTSPFRASASRDRPENCARGRGKSQPGRQLATRVERERYPQAQAADGAAPSTRRGPGCRPPCPTVGANPACGDPNPRICYRCSSPSGTRELPAIRGCASVAHSTPMAYQGIPADSLREFIALLIGECCGVTPRKRVNRGYLEDSTVMIILRGKLAERGVGR